MQTSEIGAAKVLESDNKACDTDTKACESDTKGSDTDTKALESDTKGSEAGTKASGTATKAFDCSLFGLGVSEAISCCSVLVPEMLMLHMGIEAEWKLAVCKRIGQDESPHAYCWDGCEGLKTQVPKLRLLCHCQDGFLW